MNTLITNGSNAVEIAAAIEAGIRSGEWASDYQLPSVRALAKTLGVSPNTVAAAFKALRDAGLVTTDGRRGTRISGNTIAAHSQAAIPLGLHDLASGNVDAQLLPRYDASWFTELNMPNGHDLPGDDPALLELARQWMVGQHLPGADVGVFCGALDAIERALRLKCRPGHKVLVEDPCWPPVLALLASLRLKAVPLLIDANGAQVPEAAVLSDASAVILTPRAHNPTGRSFDAQRWRQWSAALAGAGDLLVVLDDHWGPLSRAPAPALQPLPQRWMYVLSTSKFLGPDLRVSLVSADSASLSQMRNQQALGPRWVSLLLQKLAARLWQKMLDGQCLARASEDYAGRRQRLSDALAAEGVSAQTAGEGLHIWLAVQDETTVTQALASTGWAVQAGAPFRLSSPPAIRISLGTATDLQAFAYDLAKALQAPRRAVY